MLMKRAIIIQHVKRETGGLFIEVLNEIGFEILIINLFEGVLLPNVKSNDIVIILGGPMGLNDINTGEYSWLRDEVLFINYCIKNNIKIIGVCLGAQLIAHCLGGRVQKLNDAFNKNKFTPEIGWSKIEPFAHSSSNEIKTLLENGLYVLHWHADRIILPDSPDITLFASSKRCKEQFFKYKNIIGLQCHIEVTNNLVNKWILEDIKFIEMSLGTEGRNILIEQTKRYCEKSKKRRLDLIRYIVDCY